MKGSVVTDVYDDLSDAMHKPMDPKTPCRHLPSRPCAVLDPVSYCVTDYPKKECPEAMCVRMPVRDRLEARVGNKG